MIPRDLLRDTAAGWRIDLSPQQLDQLAHYAELLLRWNERTNLTTITEPRGVVVRHFLDSLALAPVWRDEPPESLADIGTGAGFPGLPLKLLWPDLRLLLVESVGKKTEFLQHVVDELGLTNVEVRVGRAEELGRDPAYRERFAAVTARAVATLNVLAEYCLPLCAIGGLFVAPKSADGSAEAQAASDAFKTLGGTLHTVLPVQLPDVEPRTIVVVRKERPTPPQYPRRTGIPAKRPL